MTGAAPPSPMCPSCGAPDDGELVTCRFCRRALSEELARTAIPCPRCGMHCRWGKQKCVACAAWLVVSCIFCGALSPHNQSACLACHEGFVGAAERKAQREAAMRHQQGVQTYGVVGNVAASFLGAMAGSAVMGGYQGHYHPSWNGSSGGYSGSYGDDDNRGPPIGSVGGETSGGGFFESGGSDGGSSDGGGDGGGSDGGGDGGGGDGGGDGG